MIDHKEKPTLCLRRRINSSKLARQRTTCSSVASPSVSDSKASSLRYKDEKMQISI